MLTYVSSMVICTCLAAVLFLCNHQNWRSKEWRPIFWIYMLVMISSFADAMWAFVEGNRSLIFLNYIINLIEFSTFCWVGYLWFCYCCNFDIKISKSPKKKWIKAVAAIPAILITFFILSTVFTKYVFYIDESAIYHRGPYFFVQQFGYIYLITATVLLIRNFKKMELFNQRKQLETMIVFIIAPALLGGAQLLFEPAEVPTLQFSLLISMILQFADQQERKIIHDSLTGLLNRYEFERILNESINTCKKENSDSLFLLMGDLDKFKKINDSLGHLAGDRALKQIATVFKANADEYNGVVARIYGDEFFMILYTDSEELVNCVIQKINSELLKISEQFPIPLSISIGYAQYDKKMSLMEFLHEADTDMYRVKNCKKL